MHSNNSKKDILVLGELATYTLDVYSIIREDKYSVNITFELKNKICLSLYGNAVNSFLYSNAVKIHQVKGKDSEIKLYFLCLGNISKDFTIDNLKNVA